MKKTVKNIIEHDVTKEFATTAKDSVIGAMKHDMFKHTMAGAAAGAVVGSLIPLVGTAAAAGVGATVGMYKAITK